MRKRILIFACVMSVVMVSAKSLSVGLPASNLDTSVAPETDFYQYACGGWMQQNPLPNDYSRFGSFDQLGLNNLKQVNGLIEELSKEQNEKGSIAQKIGDLYNLAIDTVRRNKEGIEAIRPVLDQIEAVESAKEWSKVLGGAMEYGLWAMYVDADAMNSSMNILNEYQAGFALGEKEYYLDNDEQTKAIRQAYQEHVAKMFTLCGYKDAEKRAQVVLRLETRLATAALNNVELRDPQANYNKMSIADLQKLVPEINWTEYFQEMQIAPDSLSVGQKRHLQEAGKMLSEEPLKDIKTLFIWQVIDGSASMLTQELFDQNFAFYGKVLSGQIEPTPLWKRAVGVVNGTLGEAIGQMYVQRYFPQENKERMLVLVKNLQKALGKRIEAQSWMSDETKQKAKEKLAAFTIKIGYPDKWRDYTKLQIDPALSYYENIQRAVKFEQDYSLSYLGKPVDKSKWYMTPQTVNAYYNPSSNEICFPAGILQYPFFEMSADDAFNYGAIGVVIGHEMTHGFDDQGCQFDKEGNLVNWWTTKDKANFDKRTKVMKDYFDGIEVAPGIYANGAFTLGENIADHGGLEISWQAFSDMMKEKGVDPFKETGTTLEEGNPLTKMTLAQRFFLAYANVWAGNIRPEEILQRTKSDPHSLGRWRVNGALPHIGAWYEAWNISKKSSMYVAPKKRVEVW